MHTRGERAVLACVTMSTKCQLTKRSAGTGPCMWTQKFQKGTGRYKKNNINLERKVLLGLCEFLRAMCHRAPLFFASMMSNWLWKLAKSSKHAQDSQKEIHVLYIQSIMEYSPRTYNWDTVRTNKVTPTWLSICDENKKQLHATLITHSSIK